MAGRSRAIHQKPYDSPLDANAWDQFAANDKRKDLRGPLLGRVRYKWIVTGVGYRAIRLDEGFEFDHLEDMLSHRCIAVF